MNPEDIDALILLAEQLYESKLRPLLEDAHRDEFVAIEPVSGDFFLGRTLSDAVGAARNAYPDRLSHALRVGHPAALHFECGRVANPRLCDPAQVMDFEMTVR